MLNVLKWIVSPVTEIVKGYQKRKTQITQAKHEVKMSTLKNRQRLAESEQTHNSDQEMKMLEMARPWMRWVIAGHIMVLIDIAVIDPEYAMAVFEALKGIPDWTIGLFTVVFGFYFAVTKLTEHGANLVSGWRKNTKS
jgi:hypothetical protein